MKTALIAAVIGVLTILSGTLLMDTHPSYLWTASALVSVGTLTVVIGLIVAGNVSMPTPPPDAPK